MQNLEDFRIENIPSTAYYIPNFLTDSEEELLIHDIKKTPITRWTQLSHRRLINIGGMPTPKGMVAEEIPNYLKNYVDRVNALNIFDSKLANHILLNEYLPGQGILSHFDGPLFYQTISTISIGSHTVLEFNKPHHRDSDEKFEIVPEFKILVEPRSLIVLKDSLYTDYMHSISEIEKDNLKDPLLKNVQKTSVSLDEDDLHRSTRYSLTIRHVPKTSKLKLKFFK